MADRAAMLGHSIETNLRHYSFAQKDYIDNVRAILDGYDENPDDSPVSSLELVKNTADLGVSAPLRSVPRQRPLDVGDPREPLKVINFPTKKIPEAPISRCF